MRKQWGATTRRVLLLAVLAACLVVLPAAWAATSDRVQVGQPGRNATEALPLALFITVTTLPEYSATGRFDGTSRTWKGPEFRSSAHRDRATLIWEVTFAASGSASRMASNALGSAAYPVAERPRVKIPHVVGKRSVGSLPAVALLTQAPGENNTQYESVVAFPLCRGVFAAAKFSLPDPGAVYGVSPSDPVLVAGTVPARQWNHDRALAALRQVVLQGHLPTGRVTARANGRSVTGVARDCMGHPMAGVQINLVRGSGTVARAKAAANGSYKLAAPGAGTYRVAVTQVVTGDGGSGTRSDARGATVRVR